jgi:hypothetical protein
MAPNSIVRRRMVVDGVDAELELGGPRVGHPGEKQVAPVIHEIIFMRDRVAYLGVKMNSPSSLP